MTLPFSPLPVARWRVIKQAIRVQNGEERVHNNYYHAHADYNAFTLFAQGHYFIVPPGYARRDSRFQNTISINGAHLRADPRCQPRILAFGSGTRGTNGTNTSSKAHYVLGDATTTFVESLRVQRYHRHLWMLPSNWVVIFDDVRLQDITWRAWNHLEWTVHADPESSQLAISEQSVTWQQTNQPSPDEATREPARLRMSILSPQNHIWERVLADLGDGGWFARGATDFCAGVVWSRYAGGERVGLWCQGLGPAGNASGFGLRTGPCPSDRQRTFSSRRRPAD